MREQITELIYKSFLTLDDLNFQGTLTYVTLLLTIKLAPTVRKSESR